VSPKPHSFRNLKASVSLNQDAIRLLPPQAMRRRRDEPSGDRFRPSWRWSEPSN